MDKSIAKKWAAALRSGKYKQTTGSLKNEEGYCCLGVLASISPWKNAYTRMKSKLGSTNEVLPLKIQKWADMSYPTGRFPNKESILGIQELSSKNDAGASFEKIAKLIEKHTEEL